MTLLMIEGAVGLAWDGDGTTSACDEMNLVP